MNTILMSIKPQHLVNILNGIKDEEIRKTVPKEFVLQLIVEKKPFKVVMCCTKSKPYLCDFGQEYAVRGTTIRFGTDNNKDILRVGDCLNGKVVGEFICDKVEKVKEDNEDHDGYEFEVLLKKACLSIDEYFDYSLCKQVYALHISNVVAYDKPKEIGEFKHEVGSKLYYQSKHLEPITKAPQSYQFVEINE